MTRQRILTGDRPTGRLHLGHFVGSLEQRLRLQSEYDCYFLIADYQALGDHLADIQGIRDSVLQVTLDWLAVGLDPERSVFVLQSYVPEHAELAMLLSMLTPLGMVQRNPTLKAERQLAQMKQVSVGFFTYPVSQAADILLYKADAVPAGEDQLPHIELAREIAGRFNRYYGRLFPEPAALLGHTPRLPGTDNRKMSKSLGNAIYLSDDPTTVSRKVMSMYTDPTRLHADDPGHVEDNPVFALHEAFNHDVGELEDLKARYRTGRVGDVEVKRRLVEVLNEFLSPIRERRAQFERDIAAVPNILLEGSARARRVARATVDEAREAMGIRYLDGPERRERVPSVA